MNFFRINKSVAKKHFPLPFYRDNAFLIEGFPIYHEIRCNLRCSAKLHESMKAEACQLL